MQQLILSVIRIGILSCFALSIFCIPSLAAEFTASLYVHVENMTQTGEIYVKGPLYRMDQEQGGKQFIIFVDQEACETNVFSVSKKKYMEMACDDQLSLDNDPFQALKLMVASCSVKYLGLETVNGYECEKSILSDTGTDVATQWISLELNFPIRIVNHILKNKITELRNIEEGPVDDALFQMPTGYEKKVMLGAGSPELPEWADQIPSAPIKEPPFEIDISPGDIIRIKVKDGKKIHISGRNKVDGISAYTTTPFLNGKNTRNLKNGLLRLSTKGATGISSFKETTEEADEIVIQMREGEVTLKVIRKEIEPE